MIGQFDRLSVLRSVVARDSVVTASDGVAAVESIRSIFRVVHRVSKSRSPVQRPSTYLGSRPRCFDSRKDRRIPSLRTSAQKANRIFHSRKDAGSIRRKRSRLRIQPRRCKARESIVDPRDVKMTVSIPPWQGTAGQGIHELQPCIANES